MRMIGVAFCFWFAVAVWGQGTPGVSAQPVAGANGQPAYTLHASSRVVLTDVAVTDRSGNPVHGLKAEDFRILDNKQPQTLSSFEEHTTDGAAQFVAAKGRPGFYSNEFMLHLPPVVNVLLLDINNLSLPEQMYFYYELAQFLKGFAGGQPLAIFLRTGEQCFLLQDFTADRDLLAAAVRKGIPRFQLPGRYYATDVDVLHQVALYLAPIPGRKNVIWFSGGTILPLQLDGATIPDMRPVYDELEADRISVYPVDARGLTVEGGRGQDTQHMMMNETAEATGGKAFYNSNGLDTIAARVIETDRSFYTLTYTPRDFKYDNKWHKVSVELKEGGLTLSYRRGYFADATNANVGSPGEGTTRTRLLADGTRLAVPAETATPIVFEAQVAPADGVQVQPANPLPPKRGKERVRIEYSVPAAGFMLHDVDGAHRIEVGAAALLLNQQGRLVEKRMDHFGVGIDVEKLRANPGAKVRVSQEIDAGKGDKYLYLMVWDPLTQRHGFVEVPLQVPLPVRAAAGTEAEPEMR